MTETIEAPTGNTYERLREGLSGPAIQEWREADRYAENLQGTFSKLASDPDLSDEGRVKKAQDAYERLSPLIVQKRTKAKEKALEEARRLERASVPFPEGFNLAALKIKDGAELAAIQAEASIILTTVETKRAKIASTQIAKDGKQTTRGLATKVLRERYATALKATGVEGRVGVWAVLKAAEALDIPRDDIVEEFRNDSHRNAVDQARLYHMAADSISTSVPKPPKALGPTRNRGGGNMHTGNQAMTISKKRSWMAPKRRRSWS